MTFSLERLGDNHDSLIPIVTVFNYCPSFNKCLRGSDGVCDDAGGWRITRPQAELGSVVGTRSAMGMPLSKYYTFLPCQLSLKYISMQFYT